MRVIFRLALLHVLLILLTACASGMNLREGINSFRAQDYRQAFIRLKPLAEQRQPDAEYAVGYMYYYGRGVIENKKMAWIWINRAANLGQPEAVQAVKILVTQRMKSVR